MSIVEKSNEKVSVLRKELAEFILNKVKDSFYPNSAGAMQWIPKDILGRRNSYAIYNETKTTKIVIAGFTVHGVVVEEQSGMVLSYKDFNQLSLEHLIMVAGWVETDFQEVARDVAKTKSNMKVVTF